MRSSPVLLLLAAATLATAYCGRPAQALERLDRGLVAVATADGNVYLGWRLLASDPADIGFNVFRCAEPGGEFQKLNASPVLKSCNFVDTGAGNRIWYYAVCPVGMAAVTAVSQLVASDPTDAARGCKRISLQGDYGANKIGIGDLDGDGVYDLVVKQTARVDWIARGNPRDWGDDTGNRVSRNQIGVAYLDGRRPSLLVLRGTYTMMKVDAYNYVDRKLEKVWSWFGDEEDPPIRGQGAHSLHALDVDDDGRDELILGSMALDDNGELLWAMRMGHPDWCYVADVDPDRPGLEVAYGFETRQRRNGICVADPLTGKIIWGCDHPTRHIHDWGMVADIDPDSPGMEVYGMERDGRTCWLYSAQGKLLASNEDLGRHGPRAFYWLDGPIKVRTPFSYRGGSFPILKYKGPQIGQIEGQPVAIADVLGDWREEVITVQRGVIRIYTTTVPASTRRVCLMQNHLYRMDVAMQAMGYFYPPQLGGTPVPESAAPTVSLSEQSK